MNIESSRGLIVTPPHTAAAAATAGSSSMKWLQINVSLLLCTATVESICSHRVVV
eukprot:COSAG01_NODE_851_length_13121_cov_49.974044_8_plen_55_part_00